MSVEKYSFDTDTRLRLHSLFLKINERMIFNVVFPFYNMISKSIKSILFSVASNFDHLCYEILIGYNLLR